MSPPHETNYLRKHEEDGLSSRAPAPPLRVSAVPASNLSAPQEADRERDSGVVQRIVHDNLFDFVQHECMRGLTRAVVVSTPLDHGVLYFDEGQLVHAETSQLEGEEAALSILCWRGARLESSANYWVHPSTIETSWQGILMKAAQRLDESRRSSEEALVATTAQKVFADLAEFIEFKDANLSRAVRLDSEGGVIASRGDMQDFPDAACYAVRLAELIGEGLGLENFTGLECVTSKKVMLAYLEEDMLVAVEGDLGADLNVHRKRAGT
jgi:hypothetical protein